MGHNMTVSDRHYANNVPDELFAKAFRRSDGCGEAVQARDVIEEPARSSSCARPILQGGGAWIIHPGYGMIPCV